MAAPPPVSIFPKSFTLYPGQDLCARSFSGEKVQMTCCLHAPGSGSECRSVGTAVLLPTPEDKEKLERTSAGNLGDEVKLVSVLTNAVVSTNRVANINGQVGPRDVAKPKRPTLVTMP